MEFDLKPFTRKTSQGWPYLEKVEATAYLQKTIPNCKAWHSPRDGIQVEIGTWHIWQNREGLTVAQLLEGRYQNHHFIKEARGYSGLENLLPDAINYVLEKLTAQSDNSTK